MFILDSFNKTVPAVDSTIFELLGQQAYGFAIMIENQDATDTLVYKMQSSDDGVTWEDIEFLVSGGGTAVTFSILPETVTLLKVAVAASRIRMVARGDLQCSIGLMRYRATETGTPSVQILSN